MMRLLLLFIIASGLQMNLLQAQDATSFTDSLFLNNNKVITGKIYRYNRHGNVFIKIKDGYLQEIKAKAIQQVVIHTSTSEKRKAKEVPIRTKDIMPCDKPYAFREKGLYHATYAGSLIGNGYNGDSQAGFGLSYTFGYQWNRGLGTGLGFGLENFSTSDANAALIFPVFLEARGYLLQKRSTPYYAMSVGYGFATKDEDQGLTAAKGGLRVHPAFGMRLGAQDGVNFLFDLGYVFQNVELTKSFNTWTREVQIQDIWYKRLCLRVGMIF